MKMKSVMAGLLTAAVCLSLMTACGNTEKDSNTTESTQNSQDTENSQNMEGSQNDVQNEESKQNSGSDTEKTDSNNIHKLYIRDTGKNAEMTATFLNTATGKTEDVKMEKSSESDDSVTFSCEADVTLYNMVHVTYGEITSMDVAFNKFVSGWNLMNDALLPYVEGKEPNYDPQFETKVFQFDGYDKTVYIWTPEDYDGKSEEKYSTIYMLDGQSVLATGKERGMDNDIECWNVSESVAGMMAVTDNKAIIVAIETVGSPVVDGKIVATRDDELIPDLGSLYVPEGMDVVNDEDVTKKRGNAFADFICDTVMPYVQENYNVYTDAQHTALAGSSLGGLETFYTVLAHPDKFGTGGVMSATFGMYGEKEWTNFLSDKLNMANTPFLFIYAGGYATDNGDVTEIMYNKLIENGYPKDKILFSKYETGEHFESFWRNIYPEFLEAVFTQNVTALECGVPVKYIDTTDPYAINIDEISIDENDTRPAEIRNYVYYDNSETKWEKVYVYWWGGRTVNRVTGEPYGNEWPGFEMEQIEGTDIYRIVAPLGATGIIFSTGVTDAEVMEGKEAYQTVDLPYATALLGKVYKINLSEEPKAGRGVEKTKYRYPAGDWTDYYPEG